MNLKQFGLIISKRGVGVRDSIQSLSLRNFVSYKMYMAIAEKYALVKCIYETITDDFCDIIAFEKTFQSLLICKRNFIQYESLVPPLPTLARKIPCCARSTLM